MQLPTLAGQIAGEGSEARLGAICVTQERSASRTLRLSAIAIMAAGSIGWAGNIALSFTFRSDADLSLTDPNLDSTSAIVGCRGGKRTKGE